MIAAGCVGRSRFTTRPARRASSSGLQALPGSTCRPPGPSETRSTATWHAARRSGCDRSRSAVCGRKKPGLAGSPVHVGLDSGVAGIGWVLDDLARAGMDSSVNRATARVALDRLRTEAGRDRLGAFWYENRVGGRSSLRAEPSWHWGAAGIAAFAARLAGWSGTGPGGQPSGEGSRPASGGAICVLPVP